MKAKKSEITAIHNLLLGLSDAEKCPFELHLEIVKVLIATSPVKKDFEDAVETAQKSFTKKNYCETEEALKQAQNNYNQKLAGLSETEKSANIDAIRAGKIAPNQELQRMYEKILEKNALFVPLQEKRNKDVDKAIKDFDKDVEVEIDKIDYKSFYQYYQSFLKDSDRNEKSQRNYDNSVWLLLNNVLEVRDEKQEDAKPKSKMPIKMK